MSRMYESTSAAVRAKSLRATVLPLRKAGFSGMADLNWEMAEWLDPTPRGYTRGYDGSLTEIRVEERKPTRRRKPVKVPQQGQLSRADVQAVGGAITYQRAYELQERKRAA